MKQILQEVKEELEKAYDHPESYDLDRSIEHLQAAVQQYGDKGTLITDVIQALEQARNAQGQLEHAGDLSSTAAFGEAYNGLQQAIKSYS